MAEPNVLPLELTAPVIQRIARKGAGERLSEAECRRLCECVLFHVDAILEKRRIPRVPERRERETRDGHTRGGNRSPRPG